MFPPLWRSRNTHHGGTACFSVAWHPRKWIDDFDIATEFEQKTDMVFNKHASRFVGRDGIKQRNDEDTDEKPSSAERFMDACKVFRNASFVVKQARTDHEVVATPIPYHANVVGFHASVDLNLYGTPSVCHLLFNGLSDAANFAFHIGDERLTSKPWVHAHDDHHVNLAEHLKSRFNGCGWIERHADGSASVSDGADESVEVLDRFNVYREVIATGVNVVLKAIFSVFNHEVDVEHRIWTEGLSQASDDGRAKGQVWNKITVHDVQVEPIQPGVNGFLAVCGKVGKVGGQDAGRYNHVIPRADPSAIIS
tara:strand:+ start:189 stop:1115 length:927 start_codon:yes stop_codon:yes gene_type:complete